MLNRLFEQGIAYVGTDYLAHGLWDKYIKYETAQGAFANVTRLCLRILGSPLKEIDRYFERCFPDLQARNLIKIPRVLAGIQKCKVGTPNQLEHTCSLKLGG